MSLEVMSTLPVRMTFIDFRAPLPNPRSASAPPSLLWEFACSGPSAPQSRKRRNAKRPAVQRCTASEDLAILEYRSKAIEETWTHLAERLCDKSTRAARAESTFAPRLRGSLPRQVFRDWAFYTFVNQEHAAILADLCRIGFIHENTDANLFEFWSPDVHYLEPQNAFLRNLVAEADKLLEAKEKGYFSVLVNSDIVVCILYTTQLLVKNVISQIRTVLKIDGGRTVAKHRNRTLHPGKLSEQGIGPGSHFTLDFL